MRYPARFQREGEAFNVTFPDIPEAITFGIGEDDARKQAADALETALDFYFEDKRPIPLPSTPKRGQRLIDLPANVIAKILLHNEMLAQNIRPSELADRMGIRRQEVTRILDPRHATKIETTAQAYAALGMRLEVSMVRAA